MDISTLANSSFEDTLVLDKRSFSVKKGKKFDISTSYSQKIRNVIVVSDVSINLGSHCSYATDLHLHGRMPFNGVIRLTVSTTMVEATPTLVIKVTLQKGADTCSCKDLSLDVLLPGRSYENITLSTDCGDIYLDESVTVVGTLSMYTKTGYIESQACITNVQASTDSGSFDLFANARRNISVEFNTNSGNFFTLLNNIGHIDFIAPNTTGVVRNRHKHQAGSRAVIRISSESGDIKIH